MREINIYKIKNNLNVFSHIYNDFWNSCQFSLDRPSLFDYFGDFSFEFCLLSFLLSYFFKLALFYLIVLLEFGQFYTKLLKGSIEKSRSQVEAFFELRVVLLSLKLGRFFHSIAQLEESLRKAIDGIWFVFLYLFFGITPYLFCLFNVFSEFDSHLMYLVISFFVEVFFLF